MSRVVSGSRSFGTFSGVFVPTFLSIIGVILYLRLGFITGHAGILGTIAIILLAVSVTFATGLSLSSITSNIRIGSGGAYSIISKTLGLEVGGSVGIPLYLAQVFSVVLYLFGFAEAWQFIFPKHPWLLILACSFALLFLVTYISTTFAVRIQMVVFFVVLLSLASIFLGGGVWHPTLSVPLVGRFSELSFWWLLALFFPAVTGLMAGIGLSGELKDAKKQIPKGVISALSITTVIYIAMVLWLGHTASREDLIQNSMVMVQFALSSKLVLVGILAATFSSALTTFVAAPRLLQSLGANSILPLSSFFARTTQEGEPRNAMYITSALILTALSIGSLNQVAPLLTMFFLITYSMINIVVFIEQSLGLVSFRPIFNIPRLITLYGAVVSVIFMFLINAFAGLLALVFLFVTYITLVHRKLKPKEGDVRSGLFMTIAEWAAKKVLRLPESTTHNWKPSILLPVVTTRTLLGSFPLIKSIAFPNGTMTVLGLNLIKKAETPEEENLTKREIKQHLRGLPKIVKKLGKEGIFTFFSKVDVKDYTDGICVSLEAIEGQVFNPNILFLPFKPAQITTVQLNQIFRAAIKARVGVVLFDRDEDIGLGSEEDIHVWLTDDVIGQDFFSDRYFDLSLLIAYKLFRNWAGKINVHMCTSSRKKKSADDYLKKLVYEARFPASANIKVYVGSLESVLKRAPHGDLHIIPVKSKRASVIKRISKSEKKSFLFVSDSTKEDVLA